MATRARPFKRRLGNDVLNSPALTDIVDRSLLIEAGVELLKTAYNRNKRYTMVIGGDAGAGKSQVVARLGNALSALLDVRAIYVDVRSYAPGLSALTPAETARMLLWSTGFRPSEIPIDDELALATWHARSASFRQVIVLDNLDDLAFLHSITAEEDLNIWIGTTRRTRLECDTFLWLPPISPDAEAEYVANAFAKAGWDESDCARALPVISMLSCGNAFWMSRVTAILAARHDIDSAIEEYKAFAADLGEEIDYAKLQTGTTQLLSETASRLYERLAIAGQVRTTYAGAAALLASTENAARLAMLELERYNLVIRQSEDGFILHDLVRADSRARSRELSLKERSSASKRMAIHLVGVCKITAPSADSERRRRLVNDLLQLSRSLFGYKAEIELVAVLETLDEHAINVGMGAELEAVCQLIQNEASASASVRELAAVCKSRVYWNVGQFKAAIDCARSALDENADLGGDVASDLWLIIAFSYERRGELPAALEAVKMASRYAASPRRRSAAHRVHGAIHYRSGDLEDAVQSFIEAEGALDGLSEPQSRARIANNIGFTLRALRMPDLGALWLVEAMTIALGIDDQSGYLTSLVNLAFLLADVGDINAVRGRCDEALQLAKYTGSLYEEARSRWALGAAEVALGDHAVGKGWLRSAHIAFVDLDVSEASKMEQEWPQLKEGFVGD